MFEVNDRVVLSDKAKEYMLNHFGRARMQEWGIDISAFGEGVITEIVTEKCCYNGGYAVVDWGNPQELDLAKDDSDHTDIRTLNKINFEWLEKVA